MLPPNQTTHLSKLLYYILRHKSSAYEIVLDENGYTNVDELINKLNTYNENISRRFAFNEEVCSRLQIFIYQITHLITEHGPSIYLKELSS